MEVPRSGDRLSERRTVLGEGRQHPTDRQAGQEDAGNTPRLGLQELATEAAQEHQQQEPEYREVNDLRRAPADRP